MAVVGDAQGAVEGEVAAGLGVDVREGKAELVVAQGQHGAGGSGVWGDGFFFLMR